MKSKDLSLILVVAIVSMVFASLLSNTLINNDKNRKQTAEVVQPITDQFTQPESKYFNENSIDPTQKIRIGDGTSSDPFRKTGN